MHPNSFGSRAILDVDGAKYTIFRLDALSDLSGGNVSRLPLSLKILLENLLRNEDGAFVTRNDIETLARWKHGGELRARCGELPRSARDFFDARPPKPEKALWLYVDY